MFLEMTEMFVLRNKNEFLILKRVYPGKTLDVVVFLRDLAERVTSGLDLRGQSQEITPSGYLNIQRNSENLTLCISLTYYPLVSYLLHVCSFLLMCFNTRLDKTNVNWWDLL